MKGGAGSEGDAGGGTGRAVPQGRAARLARLSGMTAGVAGNVALAGLGELGRGRRPKMRDLLLTPRNAQRITEQLAQMRGAAMKVGQLMSMDNSEILPPELTAILGRLRSDAHFMPPAQLKQVLSQNWPADWHRHFARFDVRPIAAASIGQVHRAQLKDGRDVAIKVQYPGVAESIDSDVKNVGALIRLSGLLPKGFDVAPYLAGAAEQLHEETDYLREGQFMARFRALVAADARFHVPQVYTDWSTPEILMMEFAPGVPIEDLADAAAPVRHRVAADLIDLIFAELFEFNVMQTDPNFANYRYDAETGRIILLDFGAAREVTPQISDQYRALLGAGLAGDLDHVFQIASEIGFLDADMPERHARRIRAMMALVFDALRAPGGMDFANPAMTDALNREGLALAQDGFVPPPVPMEALFLQRKFAGIFLLAAKLGARVRVADLIGQRLSLAR